MLRIELLTLDNWSLCFIDESAKEDTESSMLPIEFFKLSEFAFVLCNSEDIESNIVESLVGSIIAFLRKYLAKFP